MVEVEGLEPSQSYLCAGDLQSLELSSAQHFQWFSHCLSIYYTISKDLDQVNNLASPQGLEP